MWKLKSFRVFSALILTLVLVLTDMAGCMYAHRAQAAESEEAVGNAGITAGKSISYGGWSTNKFTVKAADGQSYLGYCAQPLSPTPSGNYTYYVYTGKNADEIRLMAYIGASDTYAARSTRNNLFAGIPDETTRYGFIHAVIGYLYSGQLTGLDSGTKDGVKNIAAGLRSLINTNHPVWVEARKMTLYYAPNGKQDIVWVGYGEGGLLLTKKASTQLFAQFDAVYSLEGAQYGVFSDNACEELKAVLTADAEGHFPKIGLDYGTYYVKEIQAPRGYALSGRVITVQVASGVTTEVQVCDLPQGDPVPVLLEKKNEQTQTALSWGSASLSGAEYTYMYYAVPPADYRQLSEEERSTLSADCVWVFRTDEGGHIQVSDRNSIEQYLVRGDLFYDTSGNIIYPVGTYIIQETKAPDGYLIDETRHTVFIDYDAQAVTDEEDGEVYFIHTYNEGDTAIRLQEQPIRGDLQFMKADEETGEVMAEIPFELSLLDAEGNVTESHTILTDAGGEVHTQSEYHFHTDRTNEGTADCGIWFGEGAEPDDTVGALPYGTYRLTELPCETNAGRDLLEVEFTIREQLETIDLGILYNQTIYLHTTAQCETTGSHTVPSYGTALLTDTVEYHNLTPGRTYVLEGKLVDKQSLEVCMQDGMPITSRLEFVPEEAEGFCDMQFEIDASMLTDGSAMVVFEQLYDRDSQRAEHEDPDDEGQSLYIPSVETHAFDGATRDHTGVSAEDTVIVDHVEYRGLTPGESYEIHGRLVEAGTGEPICGQDGIPLETQICFTASGSEGTVELEFPVTQELLAGRSAAVCEVLYQGEVWLASHEDPEDEEQTVCFPQVKTSALDAETADAGHLGSPKETTIVDTVTWHNLEIGKEYTIHGVLMNQQTEEPILNEVGEQITQEITFTAETHDGSVELEFPIEAGLLAGTTAVVFEDLLHNGITAAIHHDIRDEGQSVHYPALHTTAQDAGTGTHTLTAAEGQTSLIDTVEYTNLIPGRTYRMQGILMNRDTVEPLTDASGQSICVEQCFQPEAADGSMNMEFTLDISELAGTRLVVFERLYLAEEDDILVGRHEDICDEGQTVYVPEIGTCAGDPRTGSHRGEKTEHAQINDIVSYHGLTPGKTYTVKGILVDKRTEKPLLIHNQEITAEQSFVPEEPDGEITMTFQFDSRELHGRTLVVFERVYYEETEIAVHEDLSDEEQSVSYPGKTVTEILTGDDTMAVRFLLLLLAAVSALGCAMWNVRRRRTR